MLSINEYFKFMAETNEGYKPGPLVAFLRKGHLLFVVYMFPQNKAFPFKKNIIRL